MIPSVGRIVHYRLSDSDAHTANNHHGWQYANRHREGDVVPMLICRIFTADPTEDTAVNGQAFVDGNFTLWVTSRKQGPAPGEWSNPRGDQEV